MAAPACWVVKRKERLNPFEFRIARYVDRPHVRAALDHMAELDRIEPTAAAVVDVATAKAREERARTIAAFLQTVDGMSARQVHAQTGIPCRVISRLRSGEGVDVQGHTLERMRGRLALVHAA